MFEQTRERKRINRMMRGLPIAPVRVKEAAPLPPLKLPENWLNERRLMRLDRAITLLLALLILALITLGLLNVAKAEAQPVTMYVMVSDGSWLNGRLEPDTHGSVEARFQRGDTVDVYEVSGGWAKVAGGECGFVWCAVDYLSDTPPESAPETYTVSADGRVRVRETPDGKLVRWLSDGDTVTVQCRIDGWAYIGDGYVDTEYLQKSEPTLPGEPALEP